MISRPIDTLPELAELLRGKRAAHIRDAAEPAEAGAIDRRVAHAIGRLIGCEVRVQILEESLVRRYSPTTEERRASAQRVLEISERVYRHELQLDGLRDGEPL